MSLCRLGSRHNNWKGGTTKLYKRIRSLQKYREWRNGVLTRDVCVCQVCGKNKETMEADHFPISFSAVLRKFEIKNTREAIECAELWDVANGRALYHTCHKKTDNYGGKT